MKLTTHIKQVRPRVWNWNLKAGQAVHSGGYCRTRRVAVHDARLTLEAHEQSVADARELRGMDFQRRSRQMENAVALSDYFHHGRKDYQAFHDANANALGGFPGIWQHLAEAAQILNDAEWAGCWGKHHWIETVEKFARYLHRDQKVKTHEQMRRAARRLLSRTKNQPKKG